MSKYGPGPCCKAEQNIQPHIVVRNGSFPVHRSRGVPASTIPRILQSPVESKSGYGSRPLLYPVARFSLCCVHSLCCVQGNRAYSGFDFHVVNPRRRYARTPPPMTYSQWVEQRSGRLNSKSALRGSLGLDPVSVNFA